jgi:hypothetical protein
MMTKGHGMSLDGKLKTIMAEQYEPINNTADEWIPQIKQAFAAESYRQILTAKEQMQAVEAHNADLVYMSGQEWYDRFEKELEPLLTYPIDDSGIVNYSCIMKDSVYIAARRATGLADE